MNKEALEALCERYDHVEKIYLTAADSKALTDEVVPIAVQDMSLGLPDASPVGTVGSRVAGWVHPKTRELIPIEVASRSYAVVRVAL